MSDYTTVIMDEALEAARQVVGTQFVEQAFAEADKMQSPPKHRQNVALWVINKAVNVPQARQKIADIIAEKANSFTGHTPMRSAAAEELAAEGIVHLPPVLNATQISDVLAHLAAHGKTTSDQTLLHYSIDSVAGAPHILEALTSPLILDIVSAYLKAWPILVEVGAWESLPHTGSAWGAQLFHRDTDDFRACKLFVYLNDVGPDEGPHILVRRSHVGANKELFQGNGRKWDSQIGSLYGELVTELTGPAGTSFLENTYCFHRGKPPTKGRRIILQGLYALLPYPQRIGAMRMANTAFHSDDPRARHAARLIQTSMSY